MSRLTPFARLLIVLLIVGGAFFAYQKFKPKIKDAVGTPENTEVSQGNEQGNSDATTPTTSSAGENTFKTSFDYTPPVITNGKLKGVVELGSTGFNSFIVRIDPMKNWKLEKAEFGASLVYEKLTTDEDVKSQLKNYIANMLAYGVSAKDIHFVISSGAKKVDIIDKIIATLKSMNYYVNTMTFDQEAKYGQKAALPHSFENQGFVVDIGSGNTKIAWNGGNAAETYGAKYFQGGVTDAVAYQDVKSKALQVPANKRSICFIIGGVPYELAKQTRNGKERYTPLKSPDAYKADGEKQKAGLTIYKAIADATGCQQFIFDWDANFTIGFLLNLQ